MASKVAVSGRYRYRYSYSSYRLVCKQSNERTEQAHPQLKVRVHIYFGARKCEKRSEAIYMALILAP